MKQMTITINQNKKQVPNSSTLATVLNQQDLPNTFAVAVNGKFVPKAHYQQYHLAHDDVVAILTPMQGG